MESSRACSRSSRRAAAAHHGEREARHARERRAARRLLARLEEMLDGDTPGLLGHESAEIVAALDLGGGGGPAAGRRLPRFTCRVCVDGDRYCRITLTRQSDPPPPSRGSRARSRTSAVSTASKAAGSHWSIVEETGGLDVREPAELEPSRPAVVPDPSSRLAPLLDVACPLGRGRAAAAGGTERHTPFHSARARSRRPPQPADQRAQLATDGADVGAALPARSAAAAATARRAGATALSLRARSHRTRSRLPECVRSSSSSIRSVTTPAPWRKLARSRPVDLREGESERVGRRRVDLAAGARARVASSTHVVLDVQRLLDRRLRGKALYLRVSTPPRWPARARAAEARPLARCSARLPDLARARRAARAIRCAVSRVGVRRSSLLISLRKNRRRLREAAREERARLPAPARRTGSALDIYAPSSRATSCV